VAFTKLDELIINIQCAKNIVKKAGAAGFVPEKHIVDYLNYALNCANEIKEEKILQHTTGKGENYARSSDCN
jgi:hypothetical protein